MILFKPNKMKKILIFSIAIIIIFPIISAGNINMESKFDSGQTIIASIQGNFLDSISKENINFYRGHVKVAFDYGVIKIGEIHYFYAQTEDKTPANYSVSIEGIRHLEGNKVFSDDIKKEFTISQDIADFSIEPGFIITDGDFFIHIRNLKNSNLEVKIDELNKKINLDPFETQKVDINLDDITKTTIKNLEINSPNLKYNFLAYVIKSKKTSNETKDPDEPDKHDDNKGSECITDWNCIGSQTCENGFCVGGEDENPSVPDKNDTEEDNKTKRGFECIIDWNCKNGICENGYCIEDSKEEPECTYTWQCKDDETCKEEKCIKTSKLECDSKYDCRKTESCINNTCIPKEELIKDEIISESDDYEIILEDDGDVIVIKDGEVIKEPATLKTCSEIKGSVCSSSENCDGDSVYAKDNYCCIGSCVKKEPSKNTKTIGWILIAALGLFLLFFLSKFRKSRKRKINFDKIARGKR